MIDSNEEKNEKGVGYNSDCKAEEVNDIDKRLHLAMLFKLASIADQDSNEDMELSVRNMLEMDVVKTRYGTSRDWKDPPPDESRNELEFKLVDNPGDWGSFCYQSVFKKEDNNMVYKHHCLPTGCQPVEKNSVGEMFH